METLVATDLITMPQATAERFMLLALHPTNFSMNPERLAWLDRELQALIPQMRWKGEDRQLILIGDVLSDRGPLDTVTLALIRHFSQQAPERIVRLASNHDHNVLGYLLDEESLMRPEFIPSMSRASEVACFNQQFGTLAAQYYEYLSCSKLLHFDTESQTLFAHAPITQAHLKSLEPFLKLVRDRVPHQLEREPLPVDNIEHPERVTHFVDKANQLYQEYVLMNQASYNEFVQDLPTAEACRESLRHYQQVIDPLLTGEDGFLWARNDLTKRISLPFLKAGVKTLVHGHDVQSASSPFSLRALGTRANADYVVANLEQNVRKGNYIPPDEDSVIFRLP